MANWLTRALDVITPWNRGGEVERRKKREEEQRVQNVARQQSAPRPTPVNNNRPTPLSDILQQPTKPKATAGFISTVDVPRKSEYDPQPFDIPKPKQSFFNKIRDQFDANTDADKYRRAMAEADKTNKDLLQRGVDPSKARNVATKIAKSNMDGRYRSRADDVLSFNRDMARNALQIPLGLFRAGTGAAEGGVDLADLAARSVNAPINYARHGTIKGSSDNLISNMMGTIKHDRLAPINRRTDDLARMVSTDGGDGVYKTTQIGANAIALATGVGELANAGKLAKIPKGTSAAKIDEAIKASRTRNLLDVVGRQLSASRTPDTISRATNPVLRFTDALINRPIRGIKDTTGALLGRSAEPVVGRGPRVAKEIEDLLDEAAIRDLTKKNIPVKGGGEELPINARNLTEPKPVIREVGGDAATATPNRTIREAAENARTNQLADDFEQGARVARPDRSVDGITPRTKPVFDTTLGEARGVTRVELKTERTMLDEALANGEINKTQHKAANKALDETPVTDPIELPSGKGKKIDVRQEKGIEVVDKTDVPQGLPEQPGTTRATTATDIKAAKTQAVAEQPVTVTPKGSLSKKTQAVLDNPSKYNKRQVQSARNQLKLARQMAKTQEETAEALSRIESAQGARRGFVPTGEFRKGKRGNIHETMNLEKEVAQGVSDTANRSVDDVISAVERNKGTYTPEDSRNLQALWESKRVKRGDPDYNRLKSLQKDIASHYGQTLRSQGYNKIRRNASTNELIARYESRVYSAVNDPTKVDSKLFDRVEDAMEKYTATRDTATKAFNDFQSNPTTANRIAFEKADDAMMAADRASKQVEFEVANTALKGNQDIKQARVLKDLASKADVYQMDAVDANMLSGTGTFLRNFVNTAVGTVEEGLFGRSAAAVSRGLTGETVGGGLLGRGSKKAVGDGVDSFVAGVGARTRNAGKNPIEHLKNWSTSGNQMGDVLTEAQASKNTIDHYKQLLKSQGYKGTELTDRASVMARHDPDGILRKYQDVARTASGLGTGMTRGNNIETFIAQKASDLISAGNPNKYTELTGKLVARMTVGYPTAILRSTAEGAKRFALGVPTFLKAGLTKDPQARALLIKEGIKQAGTGAAVLPPLFYALGANGLMSGAYPDDKDARAAWEREGKSENAIKIGNAWYEMPSYLGAWAVPAMFWANMGANGGDWGEATKATAKSIPDVIPVETTLSKARDVLEGRSDLGKFMSQLGSSTVKASTPAGSLLNQLSKAFDPTKNDTNSGTTIENFVNKVMSGIPGHQNFIDVPDKTDAEGNVIKNPNFFETMAGATSAVQSGGVQRSEEINQGINEQVRSIAGFGGLDDPNLEKLFEGKDLGIYKKAKAGEQLDESDIRDLQKAITKGVSSSSDTAYLEREQYDTNLTVLRVKKKMMEDDPTTAPSKLKDIERQIKRGEVYRDNQIPYELISDYKSVGVTDWRNMGNPNHEDYDPDMYERLFAIDEAMAEAGVSYAKGKPDKQKYSVKVSGSGSRGRGGAAKMSTNFGTITGSGSNAPKVKKYRTMEDAVGKVPLIRRVRPNIVHAIKSGRV